MPLDAPIANLSRRRECTRVITTDPRRALSTQHPIDRPRHPNRQTGHPSRQRSLVVRFRKEVRGNLVNLGSGGTVGIRTVATGTGARLVPAVTIDVNIPGIAIRELKFIP